jgi:acetyl-CoA synthetase
VTPSAVAASTWDSARRQLDGLPDGRGLNIAHEVVDRHVAAGRGDRCALRCIGADGRVTAVTFDELRRRTNRFANRLRQLGVREGERVFVLLPRGVRVHVAVLGTLKHRAVASVLFPAFGPDPVRQRLALGDARVLVTEPGLYEAAVAPIVADVPRLRHVLDDDDGDDVSDEYEIGPTDPEDPALLHFTSGTTGDPKAAVHVHDAVVAHHATAASALDLRADDVFWCTADPGWVTGISYGVIAPLAHGVTSVVDEREFDVRRWYDVLERERVSVWYTSPTALRRFMRGGPALAADHDLSALRLIASVGEPLSGDAVRWGQDVLGVPIRDTWWQTETGAIAIANVPGSAVRPGSLGLAVPGFDAAILARDANGGVAVDGATGAAIVADEPGTVGHLALRPGWPSMFRAYVAGDYDGCFTGGWYVSGDLARRDADGWYWFVGRTDDVIECAGHLVGPPEVEAVLRSHRAVADVGVVGVPDETTGEAVAAFVSLADAWSPSDALARELVGFARARLGPAMAPRSIVFEQFLPKTPSGKVVRRALRDRCARG